MHFAGEVSSVFAAAQEPGAADGAERVRAQRPVSDKPWVDEAGLENGRDVSDATDTTRHYNIFRRAKKGTI